MADVRRGWTICQPRVEHLFAPVKVRRLGEEGGPSRTWPMMDEQVVIVGAGPTGLMLAVWLARQGIRALVLDKKKGIVSETRALGVQARTLETYAMLGLTERAMREGLISKGLTMWKAGRRVARADLTGMGEGLSPYPFVLMYPQNLNEALLLDHLREHGGEVNWQSEVVDCREVPGGNRLRWRQGDQIRETTCRFLVGCDGGHSRVRESQGIAFEGGTYEHYFYVADVEARGSLQPCELNLCLEKDLFEAFFPMPGDNQYRVVGVLPDQLNNKADLCWEDVAPMAEARFAVQVSKVYSFTRYRVHHRKATSFRRNNVFLCGDAAHVHSPVGAQGMNTGLMDATNLGWKLGQVLQGRLLESALNSYGLEREPFARLLVSTTDRAFLGVTGKGWLGQFLRTLVMPNLFRVMTSLPFTRRQAFRVISQTRVNYRNSPLSENGGERLAWAGENFSPLRSLDWQVHVYGGQAEEFGVPLHLFGESKLFRRGWYYLIRPDGYVATKSPSAESVRAYLRRWAVIN
jgi:2-polyprenyl-6-methoxyphenol hydroxylase-like FAD-dependent oxidoreductase